MPYLILVEYHNSTLYLTCQVIHAWIVLNRGVCGIILNMSKQAVGQHGEELAAQFLISRGFKIIGRNVKQDGVEADIVAQDGKTMVIVEVKTKRGLEYGLPQEMVGWHKQQQLRKLARGFSSRGFKNIRIDIVAVTLGQSEPKIEHLVNVVEG